MRGLKSSLFSLRGQRPFSTPVLLRKYSSTAAEVLQYFRRSTGHAVEGEPTHLLRLGNKQTFLSKFMIDKDKVKALALEWLEGKDYFLVDATVDKDNKITVEIDHKDGVWIEDCCELSRFIEEHFDRDVEDFELEVGSAGIGQPLKVLQQYINSIGYDVELLTAEGKKMEGCLKSADEQGIVVTVTEKQRVEGKKRPQMVEVDKAFKYEELKWVKNIIDFK